MHFFNFYEGSALKQTIIRELAKVYPRRLTFDQLIWRVYQGREPDNARASISATFTRMRRDLRQYGWTLPKYRGGNGLIARFQFIRVEEADGNRPTQ